MCNCNVQSAQMTRQTPSAAHRLHSVEAAAESKFFDLVRVAHERAFLLDAAQMQWNAIRSQCPRDFHKLALGPTCLQTVDHQEDRRGECRWTKSIIAWRSLQSHGHTIMIFNQRRHLRAPAVGVNRYGSGATALPTTFSTQLTCLRYKIP